MYRLVIRETAQKQMEHLTEELYTSIKRRILNLRDEPRPRGVKKLMGNLGWRIRVGDYRVIYHINDDEQVVRIAAVKPRQSAYR